MGKWETQERIRLAKQAELDSRKSPSERNTLGQFATPPALALEMAEYVKALWTGRKDKIRFLDPAIGTGALYSALLRAVPRSSISSAEGVEIDPDFAQAGEAVWEGTGLKITRGDFTRLPTPGRRKPNLILTNPPYVRHHHLLAQEKVRLQGAVAKRHRYMPSGLSGLYVYFLLLAHDWLDDGGIGIWLIPSEFMDVNYGSVVRRYLTERVTLLHIHRFNPQAVQFSDALVTSSVVVFEKSPPSPKHNVRYSYGGSPLAPTEERLISLGDIRGGQRWNGMSLMQIGHARQERVTTLADLFSIKRGIATGSNEFFILPRGTARERGLPPEFLKPVLPSPRLIRDPVIEADEDGYPLLGEQLVLLDCGIPEDQVKRRYPRLWEYLQQGEAQGIRERYLIGQRDPWYSQEQRPPAPFLCTYMGRGANGGKPFRFFWNRSRATAPNVYLMLYPCDEFRTVLEKNPALEEVVFQFLHGVDLADLVKHGRVYGGGLHKLEPKELGRIPAQGLLDRIGFRGRGAAQGQLALDELVHETSPR